MFKWLKYLDPRNWFKKSKKTEKQVVIPSKQPVPSTGQNDVIEVDIIETSAALRLADMYANCRVQSNSTIDWVMKKVVSNREIYIDIEDETGVPWYVVACIDNLEASFIHTRALHNGDKIIGTGKKTYRVPKRRGPFATWEASAIDALGMKKHLYPEAWTIGACLDFLEHYNGLGYRKYHTSVNSPYLWSMSNKYTKGKYVSDGKWSSSEVSKQVGAVVVMKRLGIS